MKKDKEQKKEKLIICVGCYKNKVIEQQPYSDETLCPECNDTMTEIMKEGTL